MKNSFVIVSGKGGVGKSLVTSMLAVAMQRRGYRTAILDADITGPSMPRMFGVHEPAMGSDDGILPAEGVAAHEIAGDDGDQHEAQQDPHHAAPAEADLFLLGLFFIGVAAVVIFV